MFMPKPRDGMRYVTIRLGKSGARFYWQRRGFPLTRLPDDEIERHRRAKELNDWADNAPPAAALLPADFSTVAAIIADYRAHDSFRELAPATKLYYERWLRDIGEMWGSRRVALINKEMCETYLNSIISLGGRREARAVLRQLLHRAVSRSKLAANPTNDIEIRSPKARQEYFDDADLERFVEACRAHPTHGRMVYIAFMLLLFTGQRPADTLRMTWRQYDGRSIRLRQRKTKKWVEVPAHPQLKEMLDALRPEAGGMLINMHVGRPVSEKMLSVRFIEVRKAAGLETKQARDLRRTAVVRMAEGGAEIQDIAAVTGHSIERTRGILEVYLPRTAKMAARGVARMANLSLTFAASDLSNREKGH
jgi:integrase